MLIYLGIDWGSKRVGLALADSETKLAIPFKTVSGAHDVAETAREEGADVLVLGKPIKMKGEGEGVSSEFLDFVDELKNILPDKEIVFIDERLSSQEADARMGDKKTKASRDEVAAMIILQSYLDHIAHNT